MKNFLVLVDFDGAIIEVKWCDPISLIDEKINLIQDIFLFEQRRNLSDLIKKCSKELPRIFYMEDIQISFDQTNFKLWCVKSNVGVYLFSLEKQSFENSNNNELLQILIDQFMTLIQIEDPSSSFNNQASTRFQFEEIQMLNNELINTRRMLEKSNGQLKILNGELNNRLVKDPLTGLISRYQYRSEIEYQISQHQNQFGVFIFMDIDDFKSINDRYGHRVGDNYLVEFAKRMTNLPIPNSVKLRIAGDEFGIFIYGLDSVKTYDFQYYWDLIKRSILDEPFLHEGKSLVFSVSAGMAVFGLDTNEVYEIIEFADFAMYNAKKSGKNTFSIFDILEYKNRKA